MAPGFTRLQCTDCGHERLLTFTCKGRHFCHQRRVRYHGLWEPERSDINASFISPAHRLRPSFPPQPPFAPIPSGPKAASKPSH
jgi:hypothetical protein